MERLTATLRSSRILFFFFQKGEANQKRILWPGRPRRGKKREGKGQSKGRASCVFGFGFLSAVPHSMWDLVPWPGIKPMPSALEMWVLPTGPPGKSHGGAREGGRRLWERKHPHQLGKWPYHKTMYWGHHELQGLQKVKTLYAKKKKNQVKKYDLWTSQI